MPSPSQDAMNGGRLFMKRKRGLLLLGVLILSTALAGCRVGSQNNSSWDSTERENAVKQTANDLVEAIENYDVAAIRELLAPEFSLTIRDVGLYTADPKNKDLLLEELTRDNEDIYQLSIRQFKGYEMVLDLDSKDQYGLGSNQTSKPFGPYDDNGLRVSGNDITITNTITPGGLVDAICYFEVYEMAPTIGINDFVCTDKGAINFKFISLNGEYKVANMYITFNGTGEGNQVYVPRSMISSTTDSPSGFGFGTYRP